MTRYALLDNVAHKDLRVVARFGREFGDATSLVPAYPTEWAELQREYPLFFRKDGGEDLGIDGFQGIQGTDDVLHESSEQPAGC